MNAKHNKSSETSEPEPEPQSDDSNPAWSALEAEAAERTAEAVANAKRSDSDVRYANAHLPAGEA